MTRPAPIRFITETESGEVKALSAEQQQTILRMLTLVKNVVGRIAITLPSHISQEDLQSAGLMGLMDAVRRYDASKNCSLKTYASMRIRGAVLDELRSMDWAPRSVHRQARDFRKAQQEIEQKLGREATEAELAKEMGMTLEQLERLLETIRPASFISLQDVRSHNDGETALLHEECIMDDKATTPSENSITSETHEMVATGIRNLGPVEQKVLSLYYYEGLRLKEIAETLHVTESRVSQIHTLAIQRLRGRLERAQNRA